MSYNRSVHNGGLCEHKQWPKIEIKKEDIEKISSIDFATNPDHTDTRFIVCNHKPNPPFSEGYWQEHIGDRISLAEFTKIIEENPIMYGFVEYFPDPVSKGGINDYKILADGLYDRWQKAEERCKSLESELEKYKNLEENNG